jgi:competence protein ComEA
MDRLPFTRRHLLYAALAAGVLLLVAGRYLASAGAPSSRAAARPAVPRRIAPSTPLVVDVVGAVRNPGLYRLAQGTRIADAVARAGGARRSADLAAINLAAPLADGEQVVVPSRQTAGASSGSAAAGGAAPGAAGPQGPVHLNSATLADLDTLPGVGPATAQKILDYRTEHGAFSSVDELDAVPGIGPKRLEELRKLVAL